MVRETRGRSAVPAAAGLTALVLVLFVLPNPLKVPQNNPTASPEFAPVPGNKQSGQNANFGETGLADSAGIGAGGEGIGALPGQFQIPPLKQPPPRQKF